MDPDELAQYYYDNYDRWFRHVRFPRQRWWAPNPLNIPNDADADVAVQNAAATIFTYADRIGVANRDRYITGALDWEVGSYWRDRNRQPEAMAADVEPVVKPVLVLSDDQLALERRLLSAMKQARDSMTRPECCAFGACWKASGQRPAAERIFMAAQSESTNYDMARNRAMAKLKKALIGEFATGQLEQPGDLVLDDWSWFLIDVRSELLTQLGSDRVYELIYEVFCRDLPDNLCGKGITS